MKKQLSNATAESIRLIAMQCAPALLDPLMLYLKEEEEKKRNEGASNGTEEK